MNMMKMPTMMVVVDSKIITQTVEETADVVTMSMDSRMNFLLYEQYSL